MMDSMIYSLGIDVGYSSIKLALINGQNEVEHSSYILHKGQIRDTLKCSLEDLSERYDLASIRFGAVTGSGGKYLKGIGDLEYINEVTSIVEGGIEINNAIGSIIEIGGQGAKYITDIYEEDKSRIKISMNSSCSAGTGSFLEEQVSRLNLKLEDYSAYSSKATSIPRIAARCSVFAKTDITHHQQEGVSVEDILLGLAYAVVRNYKISVVKRLPIKKPVLFVGGVAHNQGIITALKDVMSLNDDDIIVPEHFAIAGALGAAVIAKKEKMSVNLGQLAAGIDNLNEFSEERACDIGLSPLISFGKDDSLNKHVCRTIDDHETILDCYLGVDIGSTSTNLVLMNKDQEIISYKYLRTLGDPVKAVSIGLKELKGDLGDRINILGVGATGSGRYMIGRLIGADVIKDEITAQAKAAVTIDNSVDTVFEIGGQDSKYIRLENGIVTDFQMNKICAAGTGSFIEEQVKKFNITINDFGDIALCSKNPIDLGQKCTVFIEASIASSLSRGAKIDDIVAGLCYSIAVNYLNKVVGQKKIGNKIFLQGGIAYNQGVLNAFRALTRKNIQVPPFFSVTGAYGAAILAKDEMQCGRTKFKGFDIKTDSQAIERMQESEPEIANEPGFSKKIEGLIFEGYDGSIDCNKKTVGIPRALFTYGMFPMFNAFFKELGFNVIMSNATNEETIRLGQEYSLDETCYPVKLINGHVAELVEKKVDYIFFPDLYTVLHPGSHSRQDYGCAYMQLAFKMVNQAMELEKKGIKLLSPTIAFNLGQDFMMKTFLDLGNQLGRGPEQTARALQEGMKAFQNFEEKIKKNGADVMNGLDPDKKAFAIISKIYGVADPILNMGIPDKLMDMGYQVVAFYDLPEGDVSKEHPNMYWPFGQHILEAAQVVRSHPNLYAIFLTHHGCGPDTALTHYFREMMGEKPYLNIEVDEHSSSVGVATRVEAFINSLNKLTDEKAKCPALCPAFHWDNAGHKEARIELELSGLKKGTSLYLPHMFPYSEIFKEMLIRQGINAEVLPKTNSASLEIGRKYTIANEYFSFTTLLGDVFKKLKGRVDARDGIAFLIPQSEGAEVDGQYNRLLRTLLDGEGFGNVDIFAPFIEDLLEKDESDVRLICLGLLAGDIIRNAPEKHQAKHLDEIRDLIRNDLLDMDHLSAISQKVYQELKAIEFNKRIFAIGEPLLLFNEFMNSSIFSSMEKKGIRVIYGSLSEYMWVLWSDHLNQNRKENVSVLRDRLNEFKIFMITISRSLSEESPFEEDLDKLIAIADKATGYYAGANGRYREAKILGDLRAVDGIITVASMYENTGTALNVLHKSFEGGENRPILNLTLDGNRNENDEIKVESFIYYL